MEGSGIDPWPGRIGRLDLRRPWVRSGNRLLRLGVVGVTVAPVLVQTVRSRTFGAHAAALAVVAWGCWSLATGARRMVRPRPVDPRAFLALVPWLAWLAALQLRGAAVDTVVIATLGATATASAVVASRSVEAAFARPRSLPLVLGVACGVAIPASRYLIWHLQISPTADTLLVGGAVAAVAVVLVRPRWWPAAIAAGTAVFWLASGSSGSAGARFALLVAVQVAVVGDACDLGGRARRSAVAARWPAAVPVVLAVTHLAQRPGLDVPIVLTAAGVALTLLLRSSAAARRWAAAVGGPPLGWLARCSAVGRAALDGATRGARAVGGRIAATGGAGTGWLLAVRPAARPAARSAARVALAWGLVAVVVTRVQQMVWASRMGRDWDRDVLFGLPRTGGRVAWDSGNFLAIAEFGYGRPALLAASFPGYPLLIRLLAGPLGLDHQQTAVVVSLAAGGLAVGALWAWCGVQSMSTNARAVATSTFLLFPYAFVLYGVAYADGLLVLCVVASFIAVERRRFLVAGLLGAAASYVRPNGLAVLPALVVAALDDAGVLRIDDLRWSRIREAWTARGAEGRSLRRLVTARIRRLEPRHLAVVAAFGGIGAYMVQMWWVHDDPFFFWTIQTEHYGHRPLWSLDNWLKVEFINRPSFFVWNGADVVNQVVATVIVVVVLASIPALARRFGLGYAALGVAAVAQLWGSVMWFAPAGRYLLPVLPFTIALLAEPMADRPRLRRAWMAVSAIGLVVLAGWFAHDGELNW